MEQGSHLKDKAHGCAGAIATIHGLYNSHLVRTLAQEVQDLGPRPPPLSLKEFKLHFLLQRKSSNYKATELL